MAVTAVGSYYENKKAFPTVLAGTALGMGAGLVTKYALPITAVEDTFSKKAIIVSSRKIANQNMVNDIKAAAAKENGIKTVNKNTKIKLSAAQDAFVKMIEHKKGNEGFLPNNIAKKVKELNSKVPGAGNEFENIITAVNHAARKSQEKLLQAYKIKIKHERPLPGFLIPGAVLGLLAGAFVNAFRDTKQA